MDKKVGFIGSGSMASAMVQGWVLKGAVAAENILTSVNSSDVDATRARLGVDVCKDNRRVATFGDIVVIAVKVWWCVRAST